MIKLTLSVFGQDLGSRRYLVASRDLELPVPPFIGLELFITEVVRPRIHEVLYDVNTGEWEAYEEDFTIQPLEAQKMVVERGLPPETLEMHEESLKEAGYTVEIRSFDDDEPPRRRTHLRLVPRE